MTDSNLVQLAYVAESTWGTTPGSPSMRKVRMVSEGIRFDIEAISSNEIRSDRQPVDLVNVAATASGPINFELSFGTYDDFFESAFMAPWTKTPEKDNGDTADSVITAVTSGTYTYTVASGGDSFKAGHLVRASGFTNANNNKVMKVGSSTATTVVMSGTPTLTDESAPPAGARLKVVGFAGASGDITATAGGLSSSALDFTTLGLAVGQWIKVGGTATADKFANVAANNGWARISAIAANAITLDNKPTGWNTDNGSGKTIKIWFGDTIKNGATRKSFTFEKGFLGQDTPNYLKFPGMQVNGFTLDIQPSQIVTGTFTFVGKEASAPSTTPLDASPAEAYSSDVMNAIADVGRISEGGAEVTSPNYIQGFTVQLSNNLADKRAVGHYGAIGVRTGDLAVTGNLNTYFGDATVYNKIVNNTASSVSSIWEKNGQAYVLSIPRLKLLPGSPTVEGRNRDVMIDARYTALRDPTLNRTIQMDRLEYFEE